MLFSSSSRAGCCPELPVVDVDRKFAARSKCRFTDFLLKANKPPASVHGFPFQTPQLCDMTRTAEYDRNVSDVEPVDKSEKEFTPKRQLASGYLYPLSIG